MTTKILAKEAVKAGRVHAVINAAGKARRLGPLSDPRFNQSAMPKAVMPVLDKPAIKFAIDSIARLGVKKVHITVNVESSALLERALEEIRPEIDVALAMEHPLRGTAMGTDFVIEKIISPAPEDSVVVVSCDNLHNMSIAEILDNHLAQGSSATLGIFPLPWSAPEWQYRTFATIITEGMPNSAGSTARSSFEGDLMDFYRQNIRGSRRITGFCEQSEKRIEVESNYVSTQIKIFGAGFWERVIRPNLTPKYPDFGFHIFPAMAGRVSAPIKKLKNIRRAMEKEQFNAYFMPLTNESSNEDTYWHDIGTPFLLWLMNMKALKGDFGRNLGSGFHATDWGAVGDHTQIKPSAIIQHDTVIGSHCLIGSNVEIENSFIGDHTVIDDNATVSQSVIFPGTAAQPNYIGKHSSMRDSLFLGGAIPGKRLVGVFSAVNAVIYRNSFGGLSIDPIIPS